MCVAQLDRALGYGPRCRGFESSHARTVKSVSYTHLEGHISANYIENKDLEPPFLCLVVSGGHTHLVKVSDYGKYEILGRTRDDAAGEAFDKEMCIRDRHDMNQKRLSEALEGVVEDCVNKVGVDLNTASVPLLEHVSGINKTIAKNIVAYREENGIFKNRKELLKVAKLGPKAFEQCAGFLLSLIHI